MRLPITLSILLVLASVAHAENYTTTRPAPRQPRPEPQSAIKPVTNAWQQMVKDGGLVSRYSQQTPKQINEQTIQNPYQRAFYTGGSNNLGQPGYIGPTNNPPTASAPSTASAPPAYSYPPRLATSRRTSRPRVWVP
ncbi:MAG: hypothetical protein M5U26_18215 [Planctomycetota bacterium]|nr:hypothetical protein [Planctomycetota bacterium]